MEGWFVSPEYRTFECIPTEASPAYLTTLVKTEWFWSKLSLATRGVGARRERTRPEQFLGIELLMPDLEQQKRGERLFAQISELKQLQTNTQTALDSLLPSVISNAMASEI